MQILTSWDDGHELDLKVMELLRKYKLPGIFFIPIQSWGFENLEKYGGFEIGGHTWTHPPDLKKMSSRQLHFEIFRAKRHLELGCDKTIDWFCYPRGRYDERVIRGVKEAGFKYARTTKVGVDLLKEKPYEIPGLHCYQRKEYEKKDWDEYIRWIIDNHKKAEKDSLSKPPEVTVHIWGHSWEIEKYNEWDKLEGLFKYIYENRST